MKWKVLSTCHLASWNALGAFSSLGMVYPHAFLGSHLWKTALACAEILFLQKHTFYLTVLEYSNDGISES